MQLLQQDIERIATLLMQLNHSKSLTEFETILNTGKKCHSERSAPAEHLPQARISKMLHCTTFRSA